MESLHIPKESSQMISSGIKRAKEAEEKSLNPKKRCFLKEEANSLETKITSAANTILKMRVSHEIKYKCIQDQVTELMETKQKQQKDIYEQQKTIKSLEGKLQNEIRLREDVLHKVANSRDIYQILEHHTETLGPLLQNCFDSGQVLAESYKNATNVIEQMKNDTVVKECNKLQVENLQQQLTDAKKIQQTFEDLSLNLKKQCESYVEDNKTLKAERDDVLKKNNTLMIDISKYVSHINKLENNIHMLQSQISKMELKSSEEKLEANAKFSEYEKQIIALDNQLQLHKTASENKDDLVKTANDNKLMLENTINLIKKEKIDIVETLEKEIRNLCIEKTNAQDNGIVLNGEIERQNEIIRQNELLIKNIEDEKIGIQSKLNHLMESHKNNEITWEREKANLLLAIQQEKNLYTDEVQLRQKDRDEIAILQIKIQDLEKSQNKNMEDDIQKKQSMEQDLQDQRNAVASLMSQIKTYREQINTNENSINEFEKKAKILQAEVTLLNTYGAKKNKIVDGLNAEIKEYQEKLFKMELELSAKDDELIKTKEGKNAETESKLVQTDNQPNAALDDISTTLRNELDFTQPNSPEKLDKRPDDIVDRDNYYNILSDSSCDGATRTPFNEYYKNISRAFKPKSPLRSASLKRIFKYKNTETPKEIVESLLKPIKPLKVIRNKATSSSNTKRYYNRKK